MNLKHAFVAASLAALVVVGAAACDDDTSDTAVGSSTASQASVDDLAARIQHNEMAAAVMTLESLGLHDMDDMLNEEKTIDPSFSGNTRTAARVLYITDWSDEFAADAEELRQHAIDLLAALEAEDVDAAGIAATQLHDGEHDFSDAVWAEILGDLPEDEGGVEEHDDAAEGTPGAGEPQEEGDDHGADGESPEGEATP